jgi:hypothetical protein
MKIKKNKQIKIFSFNFLKYLYKFCGSRGRYAITNSTDNTKSDKYIVTLVKSEIVYLMV